MLPRGRPPGPGTPEEKAAIRREKVRLNVKAYRERKKNALAKTSTSPSSSSSSSPSQTSPSPSDPSNSSADDPIQEVEKPKVENKSGSLVRRYKPRRLLKAQKTKAADEKEIPVQYKFPLTPNHAAVFSDAFLDVFRDAFMPPKIHLPKQGHGQSLLVTPCSPWILTAYELASQDNRSALRSGLVAIGLIFSGLHNSSGDLKVASFQMYRKALCQLRNDLGPIASQSLRKRSNDSNSLVPYLSCLAITIFEMVYTGFSTGALKHVGALNLLIEMMYADPNVDRFTADLIVEDFGMLEMMFCLKFGFDSILRKTRQKLMSDRGHHDGTGKPRRNTSIYGDILDIVQKLPSLSMRAKAQDFQLASESSYSDLRQVNCQLVKLQNDLDKWYTQFESAHGSTMMESGIVETDADTKEGARSMCLRSYEHGAAAIYALHFQIAAIDTNLDAINRLMQATEISQMPKVQVSDEGSGSEGITRPSGLASYWNTYMQDERRVLTEQSKAQRSKALAIVVKLLEVMEDFSRIGINATGRSILDSPCERIRCVLEKEQNRLRKDLASLPAEDYDNASLLKKTLGTVEMAANRLQRLDQTMQQRQLGFETSSDQSASDIEEV